MHVTNFLPNEIYYFINKPIYIISIVGAFNLAKVHYLNKQDTFFVDINFISPIQIIAENSISIKILGGVMP